ncbi:ferredoxin--NADP reductase [Roseibacterium sp. SDUM158016]|nr:ferredoxin--NADP reductase [Roseibacterium sp. SDUM158016]
MTEVQHYTDRLFRFRCTRPASLRFRSGEFVMIGLMDEPDPKTGKAKPLLRAYSIASPAWDDELEFYSIKVPNGPLTSRLQHIKPGDEIILRPKPVGTLVHDALLPGRRVWFFATGTGIAPFASLLRDPQTYTDYDEVILTHTCREVGELTYGAELIESIRGDEMLEELIGEGFADKLRYYPTTTREESPKMGRITDLIRSGEVYADLGVAPLCPQNDRAMICGNLAFNLELKDMLEEAGLTEGANSKPAEYVVEKAFLD